MMNALIRKGWGCMGEDCRTYCDTCPYAITLWLHAEKDAENEQLRQALTIHAGYTLTHSDNDPIALDQMGGER